MLNCSCTRVEHPPPPIALLFFFIRFTHFKQVPTNYLPSLISFLLSPLFLCIFWCTRWIMIVCVRRNNMGVRSVGGVDPVTMADSAASLQAAGIDQLPFHFPTDSNWPVWVLGSLATFVIPLATGKLGPLGKLFDKFDAAVDTAQAVADMVDNMAEKVEDVADDVGNSLPAGALKDALDYVENMADQTEKAAEYAESLLNKVEEVGDKVEEFMESAVSNKPMTTTTAAMTVSVQQPQESQAEM
ncbi:hypothetical protein LINPERHAP2_LOCUS36054 [Linum perenne]